VLAAALLMPAAMQAAAAAPPPDAPLDAYGDDTFLLSTSLAPNVVLLMDNSESMSQMEWHPAFDQTVISPTCSAFTDGTQYIADDLMAVYGAPGSSSVTATECGNTRTLWDASDAKMPVALYWGRYLNWYFSDAADPYVAEIETATTTGPGCKGTPYPDVYRRTRFEASKQVMLDTLCVAETKNVRFALAAFRQAKDALGRDPNGGYLVADLGRSNPNHANELESGIKNALPNDLTYDGADETPLAEALFQIYTYWMSRNLADLPTSDQDGDTVASTFPVYAYDKFGNFDANPVGWFEDAMLFPCEKAFVVVVTDGLPTRDDFDQEDLLNTTQGFADFDDLIGDYHLDGPGEDVDERPGAFGLLDERAFFLDDIAQYMYENDFRPDMAGDQTIDTYTVGFSERIPLENRPARQRPVFYGQGRRGARPAAGGGAQRHHREDGVLYGRQRALGAHRRRRGLLPELLLPARRLGLLGRPRARLAHHGRRRDRRRERQLRPGRSHRRRVRQRAVQAGRGLLLGRGGGDPAARRVHRPQP
jgi:hypothetical protein